MRPHSSTPCNSRHAETQDAPREIPLTKGKVALVDAADFEWLSQWKWSFHRGYARTVVPRPVVRATGCLRILPMQCAILDPPSSFTVDHINLNSLDNRRQNLRLATRTQQNANRDVSRNNKSGYKGVRRPTDMRKWRASIGYQRRFIFLGSFDTPEQAALAYNEAAQRLFGEFCRLNEIARHPKVAEDTI